MIQIENDKLVCMYTPLDPIYILQREPPSRRIPPKEKPIHHCMFPDKLDCTLQMYSVSWSPYESTSKVRAHLTHHPCPNELVNVCDQRRLAVRAFDCLDEIAHDRLNSRS